MDVNLAPNKREILFVFEKLILEVIKNHMIAIYEPAKYTFAVNSIMSYTCELDAVMDSTAILLNKKISNSYSLNRHLDLEPFEQSNSICAANASTNNLSDTPLPMQVNLDTACASFKSPEILISREVIPNARNTFRSNTTTAMDYLLVQDMSSKRNAVTITALNKDPISVPPSNNDTITTGTVIEVEGTDICLSSLLSPPAIAQQLTPPPVSTPIPPTPPPTTPDVSASSGANPLISYWNVNCVEMVSYWQKRKQQVNNTSANTKDFTSSYRNVVSSSLKRKRDDDSRTANPNVDKELANQKQEESNSDSDKVTSIENGDNEQVDDGQWSDGYDGSAPGKASKEHVDIVPSSLGSEDEIRVLNKQVRNHYLINN